MGAEQTRLVALPTVPSTRSFGLLNSGSHSQTLLLELNNYEENARQAQSRGAGALSDLEREKLGVIPVRPAFRNCSPPVPRVPVPSVLLVLVTGHRCSPATCRGPCETSYSCRVSTALRMCSLRTPADTQLDTAVNVVPARDARPVCSSDALAIALFCSALLTTFVHCRSTCYSPTWNLSSAQITVYKPNRSRATS